MYPYSTASEVVTCHLYARLMAGFLFIFLSVVDSEQLVGVEFVACILLGKIDRIEHNSCHHYIYKNTKICRIFNA
jgi:hypothetical protein